MFLQPTEAHVPLLLQFQLYVELLEGYKLILHLAKKMSSPGVFRDLGFRVYSQGSRVRSQEGVTQRQQWWRGIFCVPSVEFRVYTGVTFLM